MIQCYSVIPKALEKIRPMAAAVLAIFGVVFPWSPTASAIGMREDQAEQSYLDLANNRDPYLPGPTAPDFAPVAAIGVLDDIGFDVVGSGTLVSSNLVLTAAHVLLDPEQDGAPLEGLTVRFGADVDHPGTVAYRVTEVFTPRDLVTGYAAFAEPPPRGLSDADLIATEFVDIALVRLDRPVEAIVPATMSPRSPAIGQKLFIAGYGVAATGTQRDESIWREPGLRRAAENTLDRDVAINPFTGSGDQGGLLLFDFDNGTEERNSLGRLDNAYWLAIAGRGTSDAAPLRLEGSSYPGDSGGPAFAFLDAAWRIVGVSTGGSGWPVSGDRDGFVQYGDILLYTRIASHVDWIRKTMLRP